MASTMVCVNRDYHMCYYMYENSTVCKATVLGCCTVDPRISEHVGTRYIKYSDMQNEQVMESRTSTIQQFSVVLICLV